MSHLISLPLSPTEFLRFFIVGLLGLIIFLSFLCSLILPWTYRLRRAPKDGSFVSKKVHYSEIEREPTKIIGGLGVFIIAILANNSYIYVVSLFIGGLLIASEKFMISLAAIFNSSRERVADISRQWAVEDLGRDEIKKKQQSDAEEVLAKEEAAKPKRIKNHREPLQDSLTEYKKVVNQLQNIEAEAIQKIESRLSTNSVVLKPYVRMRINDATFSFDAIGQDIISKKVLFGLEIKYYSLLHIRSVERFAERVRPIAEVSPFPIYMIIVFEKIQKDLLNRIQATTKEERLENHNIGIVYYQIQANKDLKVVNDVRLPELSPGIFHSYSDI